MLNVPDPLDACQHTSLLVYASVLVSLNHGNSLISASVNMVVKQELCSTGKKDQIFTDLFCFWVL